VLLGQAVAELLVLLVAHKPDDRDTDIVGRKRWIKKGGSLRTSTRLVG